MVLTREPTQPPPRDPVIIQGTDRLKCSLSPEDYQRLGMEQSTSLWELDNLKRELAEFQSNIVRKQKTATGRIAQISEAIRNGYEFRDVPVETTSDYTAALVTKKRLDTGEVYEQRPFNSAERQASLPMGKEPPVESLETFLAGGEQKQEPPKKKRGRYGSKSA
jgi:hypothetical protein